MLFSIQLQQSVILTSQNGIQIVNRFRVNRRVRVFRFQSEFLRYHEGVTFMGLEPQLLRDPGLMTCEIMDGLSETQSRADFFVP